MATHDVLWIDAFTERPFGGNPCAVVFDADPLSVETRIAFTRETGLVECAFVVASDTADFGARYYTAMGEIPLAGHPTVATCTALDAKGLIDGRDAFTLEVGAGVIPIAVDRTGARPVFTMTQLAPQFGAEQEPALVAAVFGLMPGDIIGTPRLVSTGTWFCVAEVNGTSTLGRAVLDPVRLSDFKRANGRSDDDLLELYLVTLGGATGAGDTFARLLLPPPMPPEDPFTGSATGCAAAYLWHTGRLESPAYVAEQGHAMGRPGRAQVRLIGPPDAIEGVEVGGGGVVVMDGRAHLGGVVP